MYLYTKNPKTFAKCSFYTIANRLLSLLSFCFFTLTLYQKLLLISIPLDIFFQKSDHISIYTTCFNREKERVFNRFLNHDLIECNSLSNLMARYNLELSKGETALYPFCTHIDIYILDIEKDASIDIYYGMEEPPFV